MERGGIEALISLISQIAVMGSGEGGVTVLWMEERWFWGAATVSAKRCRHPVGFLPPQSKWGGVGNGRIRLGGWKPPPRGIGLEMGGECW